MLVYAVGVVGNLAKLIGEAAELEMTESHILTCTSKFKQCSCVVLGTACGAMTLVQKRRTMKQEWHTFFDSHLYDGRVVHMLVMEKKSDRMEAEISIGVHILAGFCKGTGEQPFDKTVL